MNETTESGMIMITHRLKRLIGSFYHQKRPVGDYSVYVSLPLSISAGWVNLNIGGSSGITILGPTVSEQLTGGSGYTRLNLATRLRVTQTNTKIRVFTNNNVSGTMREKGAMFITRLG